MAELLEELAEGGLGGKAALHSAKVRLARGHGVGRIPSDAEVLRSVPPDLRERLLPLLRTKAVREVSGVVTVAAMSSPGRCPHGRCLYCPGGLESGSPQSYTGREPAAMRGSSYAYDPQREVSGRLEQLHLCGHPVDKVDLIIMGGTFLARPDGYQTAFVKGCYDALNGRPGGTLQEAIDQNEEAPSRCIGMTIETRPDWCFEEHIDRMLSYGTTRVEMGVQSLSDAALARMQRGHGVGEVARATRLARDAGLKVGYHMMPGFPFVERKEELAQYRRLFEDPSFRPDLLKLYPTLVMEGTGLHELWKRGEYAPMSDEEAVDFLAQAKSRFPVWVRVQRIQRDIPAQLIAAGVRKGNLRQLVRRRMAESGLSCRCIRCREVGHLGLRADGSRAPALRAELYDAAGGKEAFIHLETAEGALAGYARLRRPSPEAHRPELSDGKTAIVRELRVLGELVPIDREPGAKWQHRGLGARLMEEAGRLAREDWGLERLLVNSGAGARGYYRKQGYVRVGPYMGKTL
ncbi:MAG: tRNA uridine(34) 5-carboxymethylaminomethyl modification radical SAM/GNAT enzyme Elp3 [Euryarchaeota archaeon]|nr:tRNA uridine(34) 5-carboxymethylaminomethyl modification radical SAM/GNAT enzyme Elp3 [Euryarchaeota archaeon]